MWVYNRSFGCRGLLKEEEEMAHIKNMSTPLLPNFKILGGVLPQAPDPIGACSLYDVNTSRNPPDVTVASHTGGIATEIWSPLGRPRAAGESAGEE